MRRRTGFAWFGLVLGIMFIILGILAFLRPNITMTTLVYFYAIAAVVTGICDIIFYVRTCNYIYIGFGPTLALITGILSVMTGVVLLAYPDAGTWTIYLLFPIWFIAHNIFNLSTLNLLRRIAGNFQYYFTLIVSIIGLVLSVLMIIHPFGSSYIINCIIGIYLIMTGVNHILIACSDAGMR